MLPPVLFTHMKFSVCLLNFYTFTSVVYQGIVKAIYIFKVPKYITWNYSHLPSFRYTEIYLTSTKGNGNLLQYSCLENLMDRRAWQAEVHRVTQSQTLLKQLSVHTCPSLERIFLILSILQLFDFFIWKEGVLDRPMRTVHERMIAKHLLLIRYTLEAKNRWKSFFLFFKYRITHQRVYWVLDLEISIDPCLSYLLILLITSIGNNFVLLKQNFSIQVCEHLKLLI